MSLLSYSKGSAEDGGEAIFLRSGGGNIHGPAMVPAVIVVFSLNVFRGFGSSFSGVRVLK